MAEDVLGNHAQVQLVAVLPNTHIIHTHTHTHTFLCIDQQGKKYQSSVGACKELELNQG